MRILQPILNVREIPPACARLRQHLPSLQQYASPTPHPDEEAILAYLGQGVLCGIYNDPAMRFDALQVRRCIEAIHPVGGVAPDHLIQPNLILTDGTWLWPGALLYYVQAYHLQLPPAFLRHAQHHQWRIDPATVPVDELNWDAFDGVPSGNEKAG